MARIPAAKTSESGASTSPMRQPRWWSDLPAASRKIVAVSPTRWSARRSVAPRSSTLGRLPLGVNADTDPGDVEVSTGTRRAVTIWLDEDTGLVLDAEPSAGLVASNAVAALLVEPPLAERFVNDLWALAPPTGKWRYYNGLLQFMAMLHVSGRFRAD